MAIKLTAKKILKERGISQKDFAESIGELAPTVSMFLNDQKSALNKRLLEKTMRFLEINDFNEILILTDDLEEE